MLATEDLKVKINGKIILEPINYKFSKGKIYGIIGPNGAGKSTFLKAVSGFLKPFTGSVYFQGKEIFEPQKNISVVWQKPYMLQTTVFQNVAYGLKLRKLNKSIINNKVAEILEVLQIEHLAEQKATSLSGGETAKVAIARAVVTSPDLLILDEPTASIDPQSVLEIEKIITDLKEHYKMTIILVTHNMFQAKRIADETLFFHSGKLIEGNSTSSIFNNPKNILTSKFLSGENAF